MATRPDEVTPDDQSGAYMDSRAQRAQSAAGAALLQRVAAGGGAEASTAGESPGTMQQEQPGEAKPKRGVLATAGAVAKDVGRGAVELPRALVGGARDAVQNSFSAVADVGDWLRGHTGDVVFFGKDGPVEFYSPAEIRSMRAKGQSTRTNFDAIKLPDLADPKSNTGKIEKGITQFLVGFLLTRKATGLSGAATRAGQVAQAAGAGAIADSLVWDPHEERLSDLVQRFPKLRNPITAFLASEKDDQEVTSRLKNAVEGTVGGVVLDGLILGLKAMRSMRMQRLQTATENGLLPDLGEEGVRPLDPKELDVLGHADLPTVSPAGSPKVRKALEETGRGVPEEALESAPGDVFINFRNINTPEDVQNTLQGIADAHAKSIDEARRGSQTFEEIKLNADQEDAWAILMERRKGEPLNAEQSVAARRLWTSSAEKLTELAQLASANPSEANLFAFRKMLATHHAIQGEVIAARTETARALSSWRIPVGGGQEMTRALAAVLEESGGTELAREMAQRITRLSEAGYARELDAFVRGSVAARTKNALMEAWINGLLSGPKTHLVNMISNSSVAFMQMYERAAAARIGHALGDQGVIAGEAMAQWSGLVDGLKDAFTYAKKAFFTGETGFGIGKVDVPNKAAISSESLGLASSGWLGRTVDVLGNNVARIPTRALGAADEFFKTIGYRMELRAQALRMAAGEVHAGAIPAEQLKSRMADIIANPPENVRVAAVDQATYQTFTNAPGELTKLVMRAANKVPAVRILLPFIRTPSNILRYTFERSPLAPMMKQVQADVAAGGARRDLALARMGTGTAVMLATADMSMSGIVTGGGPAAPAERQALQRTGWQPYSVKIGDRYFAFNRADPLGMTLGLAADMTEILANGDEWKEGAEADEVAIALVAAIGSNTMSKSYLSGLSDFFEAMSDPKRSSESYAQRLAGSLVPTGVAEIARAQDPYMREVRGIVDAMRARTPGLSESLPPRRDLWGRPLSYESGMGQIYDMASPIYSRKEDAQPIDKEILRLESPVSMPRSKASFDGVTVDLGKYPGSYSRYVELAGNALKHPAWDMGAMDFLNAVVTGKHPLSAVYQLRSDGPDGGKDVFIRDTIRDYQEMARRQLLDEYPDLRREVDEKKTRARMFGVQAAN